MRIVRLVTALDILTKWPDLKEGFLWLKQNARFEFEDEKTLQQLLYLSGFDDKFYILLAYHDEVLRSFLIAFEATPIFSTTKVFQVYALMHSPKWVHMTRKVLNRFELWAQQQGGEKYHLVSNKFSSPSFRMFSKLGFKKSGVVLTKEF